MIKVSSLSAPTLFKGAGLEWGCLKWDFDALINDTTFTNIITKFRLFPRRTTKVIFEGDSDYIISSLGNFVKWMMKRDPVSSELQNYDVEKYCGYGDYKHFTELFQQQEAKEVIQHNFKFDEVFGLPQIPKNTAMWIGTKDSYTPAHYDSYGFNLVIQIRGQKHWTLYPPNASDYLYPTRFPYEESSVFSPIRFSNPDEQQYPDFKKAKEWEIQMILNPGDILFVPRHWWHFVESLEDSISVNQWFELPLEDDKERVNEAIARLIICGLTTLTHQPEEQEKKEERGGDELEEGENQHGPNKVEDWKWLNPTEEVWNHAENLQVLNLSLFNLGNSENHAPQENEVMIPSEKELTKMLCDSIARCIPEISLHLIKKWNDFVNDSSSNHRKEKGKGERDVEESYQKSSKHLKLDNNQL